MKYILPLLFLLTSVAFAENKTNVNVSLGQSSFFILNGSYEKWVARPENTAGQAQRLKIGLEGNYIYRNIVTIPQNVLDLKIYTGWKVIRKEEISLDLRIGYGVQGTYYPSNQKSDYGYAPLIGANLKLRLHQKKWDSPEKKDSPYFSDWMLNVKMMCSIFSDGIGAPYQIGVNHKIGSKNCFFGLQGIFGLSIGNKITTNIETGLCAGIEF